MNPPDTKTPVTLEELAERAVEAATQALNLRSQIDDALTWLGPERHQKKRRKFEDFARSIRPLLEAHETLVVGEEKGVAS